MEHANFMVQIKLAVNLLRLIRWGDSRCRQNGAEFVHNFYLVLFELSKRDVLCIIGDDHKLRVEVLFAQYAKEMV